MRLETDAVGSTDILAFSIFFFFFFVLLYKRKQKKQERPKLFQESSLEALNTLPSQDWYVRLKTIEMFLEGPMPSPPPLPSLLSVFRCFLLFCIYI